jgi:hypothetical protein
VVLQVRSLPQYRLPLLPHLLQRNKSKAMSRLKISVRKGFVNDETGDFRGKSRLRLLILRIGNTYDPIRYPYRYDSYDSLSKRYTGTICIVALLVF